MTTDDKSSRGKSEKDFDFLSNGFNHKRKSSTETLNRLILVAQALETEVLARQKVDISASKIIFSIRFVNLILLVVINVLIVTGFGQYSPSQGRKQSLTMTIDKWMYSSNSALPASFSRMILSGQYVASVFSMLLLFVAIFLQVVHVRKKKNPRFLCMCLSFGSVPFSLFVFGVEVHYSACPWLEDFYRAEYIRRGQIMEREEQCGINGWALAGIFSLLSSGFFISEGLISAFFRSEQKTLVKCEETHV